MQTTQPQEIKKYCVSCRHYGISFAGDQLCVNSQLGFSPVNGSLQMSPCRELRKDSTACGPSGLWFEEITEADWRLKTSTAPAARQGSWLSSRARSMRARLALWWDGLGSTSELPPGLREALASGAMHMPPLAARDTTSAGPANQTPPRGQVPPKPAPKAMATTAIDRTAIEALCNRWKQLVLTCAAEGKPESLQFAQGGLNALSGLLRSKDVGFLACLDASIGGYQPLGGFEAAWPALPDRLERLTLAQVQEFLRSRGIKIASDAITDSKINAVEQLKDSVIPAVNCHDEHGAARADLDDCSGLHGSSCVDCATVAQGGAA